ncbi:hypothetical protein LA03_11295 [Burkholderia gladioli]|uniref:DUF4136 domain-containing protein n=1 Tax=Burkholderia gladioli TaxID=28095 RepID=UPI00050FE8F9|nr:DUF4136 domain-containing protein [Burkholderia gladioli]KGE10245.1 hypothetical protein LA03_11295 [Burkholderia gladioli]
MKTIGTGAAIALALLGGCAAPTTGVSVAGRAAGFGTDVRNYAFARTESQDGDGQDDDATRQYRRVESLVRDELARQGYHEQPDGAPYRLAIAYATQPGALALGAGAASGAASPGVRVDGSAPLALPFAGPVYRHLLTLRFVDSRNGETAYQVTASSRDRQADPLAAMPNLVRSALAKLPYQGGTGWLVRTRPDAAGGMPGVVSVKPAEPK